MGGVLARHGWNGSCVRARTPPSALRACTLVQMTSAAHDVGHGTWQPNSACGATARPLQAAAASAGQAAGMASAPGMPPPQPPSKRTQALGSQTDLQSKRLVSPGKLLGVCKEQGVAVRGDCSSPPLALVLLLLELLTTLTPSAILESVMPPAAAPLPPDGPAGPQRAGQHAVHLCADGRLL